jgi:NADH-quinone oxidoreductase subunit A
MIFIVFDIEIIFFYPWAIAHEGLGLFGLVAVLIFSTAVFESFVYLIGNGALEWGPVRRFHHAVSPRRTSSSTIRRVGVREVGLEGRELVGLEGRDQAAAGDRTSSGDRAA